MSHLRKKCMQEASSNWLSTLPGFEELSDDIDQHNFDFGTNKDNSISMPTITLF
ncbi:MAG: hypothetical protein ABJV04_19785 [Aliiglaciecola sp.]|uniref:hypothetical protein n=1 Tax=Aliiglaciecola sp. TaxID=1872441 RepID=UPI003296F085